MRITANGLDGEGTANNAFDIDVNKYVGTRIPFTIRVKDVDAYTSKQFNRLTLIGSSETLSANSIKIWALSGTNILPITALSNFGALTATTHGAFFNGYIEPLSTYNNIALSAIALVHTTGQVLYPTPIAWLSQPQSQFLHKLNIKQS